MKGNESKISFCYPRGNKRRGGRKHCFVNIWRCFNRWWVRGGGVWAESVIQGQLKLHPFSGGILDKEISMTRSDMYILDVSMFYFY